MQLAAQISVKPPNFFDGNTIPKICWNCIKTSNLARLSENFCWLDLTPNCNASFSELKCVCRRGHLPTFLPAPILSSRLPKLIYCSPDPYYRPEMASQNLSQIIGKVTVADINKDNGTAVQYYPSNFCFQHC